MYDLDPENIMPCERIPRRWWIVPAVLLAILAVMCFATYRKAHEPRVRVERVEK